MPRYAEGTRVSVIDSRGEITGILAKHGVTRMAWGTAPEGDELQFELGGHRFRFDIPRPTVEEVRAAYLASGRTEWGWGQTDQVAQMDAEWRRRWRANVLLLKAKLEFIEGGDTTLEREFMPYMLTASGETLGDWIESAAGQKLLPAKAS